MEEYIFYLQKIKYGFNLLVNTEPFQPADVLTTVPWRLTA